ncbi:MAG: trigger factor [bacterium]
MGFWPLSADKTKVRKLNDDGCSFSFSVEVPREKYMEAEHDALIQVQSRVSLPGFRVGKAPIPLVKQNFSDLVSERALDRLIKNVLPEVIKEQNIEPVAMPVIKSLKNEGNSPVSFQFDVECAPRFEPKSYTKLSVTRTSRKITDMDVENQIKELLEHNARLEAVPENEAVGKEHFAVVDYESFTEGRAEAEGSGKGELVDMSSPQTIAGLAECITGAKKGETREFDSEFSGRKLHFRVTVGEIKRKVLPELNDGFVKEMGFESVEQLKGHLKQVMEKDAAEKTDKDILHQLEDHLVRGNPIPVPLSLVESQLTASIERIKERLQPGEKEKWEESRDRMLRERFRPAVEKDVRLAYLLRSIARREKLEAGPADFETELEKALEKITDEKQKKDVRRLFESRREDIMAAVTEKKVIEFIKSQANIKEAA